MLYRAATALKKVPNQATYEKQAFLHGAKNSTESKGRRGRGGGRTRKEGGREVPHVEWGKSLKSWRP